MATGPKISLQVQVQVQVGDPIRELIDMAATPISLCTTYNLYIVYYLLWGIKALVTPGKCLAIPLGVATQGLGKGEIGIFLYQYTFSKQKNN